eukprot:352428-Chlamydomonas_euryale.AAC.7
MSACLHGQAHLHMNRMTLACAVPPVHNPSGDLPNSVFPALLGNRYAKAAAQEPRFLWHVLVCKAPPCKQNLPATARAQDADGEEGGELGGPGGMDEEDERAAWLLRLQLAALRALESRCAVKEEADMLAAFAAHAMERRSGPPAHHDTRMRADAAAAEQEAASRARVLHGLRNVASSLAASSGSGGPGSAAQSGGGGMPLPLPSSVAAASAVGGHRDALRAAVFRPSHILPTMTVEEFGAIEAADMMAREAASCGAAAAESAAFAARTHAEEEYDDEETERQRARDEFKDSNPTGWGNSALRPCGR